jgi:hypothetical protein
VALRGRRLRVGLDTTRGVPQSAVVEASPDEGDMPMARPPGRDQNAPMERLVRLLGALTKHRGGAPLAVLL